MIGWLEPETSRQKPDFSKKKWKNEGVVLFFEYYFSSATRKQRHD